jgi:LPS export ABC transporter protein LptC
MAINRFIYLMLALSVLFLFYKRDTSGVDKKEQIKPVVTFKESVMYDLSTENIEHILHSKKALIYNDHDELYDATLMARAKKSTDTEDINNISANIINKYNNDIYFNGNVIYNSYDGLIFKTEELEYNTENKIAKTDTFFEATKGSSNFKGSSLIYDSLKSKATAEDTKFRIDLKEKNENDE